MFIYCPDQEFFRLLFSLILSVTITWLPNMLLYTYRHALQLTIWACIYLSNFHRITQLVYYFFSIRKNYTKYLVKPVKFKLINDKSTQFIHLLIILIPIAFHEKGIQMETSKLYNIAYKKYSDFILRKIKRRRHTSEEDAGDPYWHHSCLG